MEDRYRESDERPIPRYGYGNDDRTWAQRDRIDTGGADYVPESRERPGTVAAPYYDHRDVRLDEPGAPYAERVAPVKAEAPVAERKFSLGATFLGWAVASFFTVVIAGLASAIFAGVSTQADYINSVWTADAATLANATVATLLVSMFIGYVIGGYAAGRIALWDGVKHGALTVIWPVLLTILGAIAAFLSFDALAPYIPAGIEATSVTTGAIVFGLASLLVMIAGGALGGRLGERYHKVDASEYRRKTTSRGRPL